MIGGKMSGLYDEQGNARRGLSDVERKVYTAWSGMALIPAAPLGASQFFTPEQWDVIATLLKAIK